VTRAARANTSRLARLEKFGWFRTRKAPGGNRRRREQQRDGTDVEQRRARPASGCGRDSITGFSYRLIRFFRCVLETCESVCYTAVQLLATNVLQ